MLFTSRDFSTSILDLGAGQGIDNLLLASGPRPPTCGSIPSVARRWATSAVGVIKDGVWMHVAATLDSRRATGAAQRRFTSTADQGARSGAVAAGRQPPEVPPGSSNWYSYYKRLRGRLSRFASGTTSAPGRIRAMMGRPLQGSEPGLYRYYPLTDAGSQIKGVSGNP